MISPPSQISVAAGAEGSSEVSITWITDDTRNDEQSCKEVAKAHVFDLGKPAKAQVVIGECLRYSYGASPQTFGNYTSGRIHRVRVSGLKPRSWYNYSLHGSPAVHYFRTMAASLSIPRGEYNPYPMIFGVVGDLGQTNDSVETVRHLNSYPDFDAILHAGDLPYADSNGSRWDTYGHMVEPLSSRLQWMACPGNHEIESDFYTGMNFVPYEARLGMPAVKAADMKPNSGQIGCLHPAPSNSQGVDASHAEYVDCTPSEFMGVYDWGNSFYAFNAGPVRIISLNSYTSTAAGSPQHTWFKSELESLRGRRDATPWLVVMMHCPWYNSNKAHQGERQTVMMRDLNDFEELFYEHNVSLVLTGHVHAYERSHPVYRNTTRKNGPTYIVIGDGGNREGHASDYGPRPSWSAFRSGTAFGHGRVEIVNNTHLRWDWLVNDETKPRKQSAAVAREFVKKRADRFSNMATEHRLAWMQPLADRTPEDSVWIVNPYADPHWPAPELSDSSQWAWI
jgi:predicted phosphodiesterase